MYMKRRSACTAAWKVCCGCKHDIIMTKKGCPSWPLSWLLRDGHSMFRDIICQIVYLLASSRAKPYLVKCRQQDLW